MSIIWKTPPGRLRILTERVIISEENNNEIILETESNEGSVSYSLISGQLPRGLRIDNSTIISGNITKGYIKGSPVEVRKFTESRFVIRASTESSVIDRTFSIAVDGSDEPEWLTQEGFLNVGNQKAYYILDNSRVEFQLEAEDTDINAGETLEYFLMPRGGELPPGLTLSSSGVISGYTDPIFALDYQYQDNGSFDIGSYDTSPLDFGKNNAVGFDYFLYDLQTYDYSEISVLPRRLSRVYTFSVGVSDGIYTIPRIFKIYVVTEDFLKADNTLIPVDTNVFTADSNQHRIPIWITGSDLGKIRADNYVTIYLDVYNPPTLPGTIVYFLLPTNPGTYRLKSTGEIIQDGSYEISGKLPFFPKSNIIASNSAQWETLEPETESTIPPGLELDPITGELAGKIPYQDRVTKKFTFTMQAVDFPAISAESGYELIGDWNSNTIYEEKQAIRFEGLIYICVKRHQNKSPRDEQFWQVGVSTANKTFIIEVIGEIESGIRWISDDYLGELKPNQPSAISVMAETQLYGGKVVYEFVSGILPPGLNFISTGNIVGKIRQFGDSVTYKGFWKPLRSYEANEIVIYNEKFYQSFGAHFSGNMFDITWWKIYDPSDKPSGLTTFSDFIDGLKSFTVFDSDETTFDRIFKFKIKARDTARAAENSKDFYITVIPKDYKIYSNLYLKAFQNSQQRLEWFDFISDVSIFDPNDLYRYGDENFSIQSEIKILIFAGIESTYAMKFVQAMSRNHYRKRLLFGDVKTAKAKDPLTQETIYEIIYVDIIDEYEKDSVSVKPLLNLPDNTNSKVLISYDNIRVDSDIPLVSDQDHQRIFPNSIKNMRKRIKGVGQRDRELLPLWMRSIQDSADYELGYTKSLVLCYAKPEKSRDIIAKIKANGFDFKLIDFYADRYIIDSIDGRIKDQYLVFPQRDVLNKLFNPRIVDTFQISSVSLDSEISTFDSDSSTFDQG
jgi:hypothetical protein